MALNKAIRKIEIICLRKKLVLFGDLIKHLVSLNSWFQISSQNLSGEINVTPETYARISIIKLNH